MHLGDVDRADDVFLRASDLDPAHVPTLRRLSTSTGAPTIPARSSRSRPSSTDKGALSTGPALEASLAHALVAAALIGDTPLAARIGRALGEMPRAGSPRRSPSSPAAEGRLQLASASTAIAELARRGVIDLAKVRAAAAGTAVADLLATD